MMMMMNYDVESILIDDNNESTDSKITETLEGMMKSLAEEALETLSTTARQSSAPLIHRILSHAQKTLHRSDLPHMHFSLSI